MKKHVAREQLERMLAGDVLEESDLRELMKVENEGQYVDFKHGSITQNRDEAKQVVRSYATGFGNADGGLLVIGVSDGSPAQRAITATKRPGGATLDSWARSCIDDLAGQLVPFPRFQVLQVDGCEVLIVATGRAPTLVPCFERGARVYYLRVGDATKAVPDYLLSDLLVGRRAHPVLAVRGYCQATAQAHLGRSDIGFWLTVENQGFVPAPDLRVGLIAWGQPFAADNPVASDHLRSFVEQQRCADTIDGKEMRLVHWAYRGNEWAPFEERQFGMGPTLKLPAGALERPMSSALYLLARGHPPEWYQANWVVPSAEGFSTLELTRLIGDRPVVAYDREWRSPATIPPPRRPSATTT
jgi:hypothetical protein